MRRTPEKLLQLYKALAALMKIPLPQRKAENGKKEYYMPPELIQKILNVEKIKSLENYDVENCTLETAKQANKALGGMSEPEMKKCSVAAA